MMEHAEEYEETVVCDRCNNEINERNAMRLNMKQGRHLDLCPQCYSDSIIENAGAIDFL